MVIAVTTDEVVQVLVPVAILAACLGLYYLQRWLFRRLATVDVSDATYQFIRTAALATLGALKEVLEHSDPSDNDATIEKAAREVYQGLPATLTLNVRGLPVPIPFKLLVSEGLFIELVLGINHEVDSVHHEVLDAIESEYEEWKKRGLKVPIGSQG